MSRLDQQSRADSRKRITVVTGSRADFGLLTPVMQSVRAHQGLELAVIAAGSHLVSPAETYRDIKRLFADHIADGIPMQVAGRTGRIEDAEALGVGVSRFARSFARLTPAWVVVLGDRIEAFAAASAASVGGFALAHIHGGDRAEGVADEAMRHATTKLAHLHLAATEESAGRIRRMGEKPETVHVVGSPAIDGLDAISALGDAAYNDLGAPDTLLLIHPTGREAGTEQRVAEAALEATRSRRVLALHPNLDPGRDGILAALQSAGGRIRLTSHLERERFIGLLKRLARDRGVIVGNSSGALIEAGALRLPAVDIGPRNDGRERGGNAVRSADESAPAIRAAIDRALSLDRSAITHPFGEGHAGPRIAELLFRTESCDPALRRKRCVY